MKTTICVQIGNSDDRLTQAGWSNFVSIVNGSIKRWSDEVHFSGHSGATDPWQNACWVFDIQEKNVSELKSDLIRTREVFLQKSIAWMEGKVSFI